jgi:hypothetical protein
VTARPHGDRALLTRAWALAVEHLGEDRAWHGELGADLPTTEAEADAAVALLEPLDVLQRAHALVTREWIARGLNLRRHGCGWCVTAAIAVGASEDAAWHDAPSFDSLAGIQEHVVTCKHNPLVKRINDVNRLAVQVLEALWGRP